MNEKMYKASDVIGVLLEEITNAEFLRVAKRLSGIPSAVVRCKDCMEYRKFATKTDETESDGFCLLNNFGVNAGDFCSDAERKIE